MNKSDRRKTIFANKLHRETFLLVFLAALVPTLLATISLYYLIFGVTAMQLGIPEAIAYNIIPAAQKVTMILVTIAPIIILGILLFAFRLTHAIVGPFDRIVRELDEHIEGKKEGRLFIRKRDKFWPLVHKINKLLSKAKKS